MIIQVKHETPYVWQVHSKNVIALQYYVYYYDSSLYGGRILAIRNLPGFKKLSTSDFYDRLWTCPVFRGFSVLFQEMRYHGKIYLIIEKYLTKEITI